MASGPALSTIDTSKMSPDQRAALELTEAAREAAQAEKGFCGGLLMGHFHLAAIHPFPNQSAEDREKGDVFFAKTRSLFKSASRSRRD